MQFDCLSDGGRIIVEDFAYESADENTLCWFLSSVSRPSLLVGSPNAEGYRRYDGYCEG